MTGKPKPPKRRKRGFERTASLLKGPIRSVGEQRGFTVTRLLTHWNEIVGEETAQTARPVNVHYGRQGLGATLTVLTTGSMAPLLEMQKEKIREKVNACYGYAAISRIRLTQTAPTGFAEGQAQFTPAPKASPRAPDARMKGKARDLADGVTDPNLRAALENLGCNVLNRSQR